MIKRIVLTVLVVFLLALLALNVAKAEVYGIGAKVEVWDLQHIIIDSIPGEVPYATNAWINLRFYSFSIYDFVYFDNVPCEWVADRYRCTLNTWFDNDEKWWLLTNPGVIRSTMYTQNPPYSSYYYYITPQPWGRDFVEMNNGQLVTFRYRFFPFLQRPADDSSGWPYP